MKLTWDYIAGFFDGEGSVSTMCFTHRQGIQGTVATLSHSGAEGLFILTQIRDFLWERGIKGYLQKPQTNGRYRPMHNLKMSSRASTEAFLKEMLPRVSVKRVIVQDTLRFFTMNPSIRGPITAERNRERGKQGAVQLDVEQLKADRASGMPMKELAAKYNCNAYTIKKYLDPEYRVRYDAYRKEWRAKRAAQMKAASAA